MKPILFLLACLVATWGIAHACTAFFAGLLSGNPLPTLAWMLVTVVAIKIAEISLVKEGEHGSGL